MKIRQLPASKPPPPADEWSAVKMSVQYPSSPKVLLLRVQLHMKFAVTPTIPPFLSIMKIPYKRPFLTPSLKGSSPSKKQALKQVELVLMPVAFYNHFFINSIILLVQVSFYL